MNYRRSLSTTGKLTIVGMVVAAVGISTLFLTNSVAAPPIPIGPILLLSTSALLALGPWRWTPIVAVILSLAIFVGGLVAPGLLDHLSNLSRPGALVGTWLNMLGLATAIISGTITLIRNYQGSGALASR